MTPSKLKTHTVKDLAAMAKKQGIAGWHGMRKDELVRALANAARAEAARKARRQKDAALKNGKVSASKTSTASRRTTKTAKASPPKAEVKNTLARKVTTTVASKTKPAASSNGKAATNGKASLNGKAISNGKPSLNGKAISNGKALRNGKAAAAVQAKKRVAKPKRRSPEVDKHIAQLKERIARAKELDRVNNSRRRDENEPVTDRLILLVRDPYWLHAYWELSRRSIERVRAAMGRHWHTAKPVLRLYSVLSGGVSSVERNFLRDIEIHGAVNNWYVDVKDPPSAFSVEIGYISVEGRFFSLARSNTVETPQVTEAIDGLDGNWAEVAEDFDRIYALSGGDDEVQENDIRDVFEEKLRRPVGGKLPLRVGPGAQSYRPQKEFDFSVEAEMIVHGSIEPGVHLTIKNQPVRVRPDGAFSVRFNLPERRLVLPVVASTGDGVEQRTIVLAVERNTKIMEPVIREPDEA